MTGGPRREVCAVIGLEERAMNAWPALRTVLVGGWQFRFADGCTKRANSVNALTPCAPFDEVMRVAEDCYARVALPPIFRVTPLAPADCDAALAAAGYSLFDPSLVMVAPLAPSVPDVPADAVGAVKVEIRDRPDGDWRAGVAASNGIAAALRPAHDAIIDAIIPATAFATLRHGGRAIGFGLAVRERAMVGLFDIVIAPEMRGKGHGRVLCRVLMAWGRDGGAGSAYLQVRAENTVATRLYQSLGFAEAYRYHYRLPPPGCAKPWREAHRPSRGNV